MMRKGDLPERTEAFARKTRELIRQLPRTLCNIEDAKQLVRSSGSVAANQIEADEPLGEKDQLMKFKICRKEAKESRLWLSLLEVGSHAGLQECRTQLHDEALQLVSIYSTIIRKLGG
ncbi:four helix bundle protein [Opitutaceae bacterium TAV4]|uniref:four helix bundle protein n=1 Tax=Geminisphaera colitermitum TaxID=1148786 RepID=UPI000158C8FA|nr:four helix bundle protein [Opitutaceae bacterium TAV4]RRJ99287.1 four helix bundle protein [Opitutaceae bacterium TAV3]